MHDLINIISLGYTNYNSIMLLPNQQFNSMTKEGRFYDLCSNQLKTDFIQPSNSNVPAATP